MSSVLFIIGGGVFLALLALAAFAVLVVSIRRAPCVPLSQIQGQRAGSISRGILVGFRSDNTEGDK